MYMGVNEQINLVGKKCSKRDDRLPQLMHHLLQHWSGIVGYLLDTYFRERERKL